MPALSAVLRPEAGVEFATVDVVVDVEEALDVGDELAVLELEDVIFDLMTKPRLVNRSSMKPGGLPVEVWPVGSLSWNAKFGLMASCFSSIPSFAPILHV
jgi:hypothetical protein